MYFLERDNRAVINQHGLRVTAIRCARAQMNNSKYEKTPIDKINVVINKMRGKRGASPADFIVTQLTPRAAILFSFCLPSLNGGTTTYYSHARIISDTHTHIII